jgi:hypothetical protein
MNASVSVRHVAQYALFGVLVLLRTTTVLCTASDKTTLVPVMLLHLNTMPKSRQFVSMSLKLDIKQKCALFMIQCGSTVVKVLRYKSEGRWFDSRWCHEIFP